MKYFLLTALLLVLSLARGTFASGNVFINEVAWMGALPKDGESTQAAANNEWMELYNPTSAAVSLDGWRIAAEDGTPDISLSGSLGVSGFFLLERTDDNTVLGITADLIYTGALEDVGERLFLKNSLGTIVDEVDASLGWPAGNKETKETMQKVNGVWVSASSTPRAPNIDGPTTPEATAPSPASGAAQILSLASGNVPPQQQISAYAGEDREVVVGSFIYFLGQAMGFDGKPLENARFWWNFGDGGTKEGRSISYIYQFPGNYTVGLHVSSGSYAASDYVVVKVVPNQLAVEGVLQGEGGFVHLENKSGTEVDIGGWSIVDGAGVRFIIPPKTRVGAQSDITLPNDLTGLLKSGPTRIEVFYPSTTKVAFKWNVENRPQKPESVSKAVSEVTPPKPLTPRAQVEEDTVAKETAEDPQREVAEVRRGLPPSRLFFISALILALASAAGFVVVKKLFF